MKEKRRGAQEESATVCVSSSTGAPRKSSADPGSTIQRGTRPQKGSQVFGGAAAMFGQRFGARIGVDCRRRGAEFLQEVQKLQQAAVFLQQLFGVVVGLQEEGGDVQEEGEGPPDVSEGCCRRQPSDLQGNRLSDGRPTKLGGHLLEEEGGWCFNGRRGRADVDGASATMRSRSSRGGRKLGGGGGEEQRRRRRKSRSLTGLLPKTT